MRSRAEMARPPTGTAALSITHCLPSSKSAQSMTITGACSELNDRLTDAVALAMKMLVSQQPIDGFDLVLHVRWAIKTTVEVGERQLPAAEQSAHDAEQRRCASRVCDDQPIGQPL